MRAAEREFGPGVFSADHRGIELVNENGLPDNEQMVSSPGALASTLIELAAISIIHHYAISPPASRCRERNCFWFVQRWTSSTDKDSFPPLPSLLLLSLAMSTTG